MISLFDYYTQESKDLHRSLQHSGFSHETVVIFDDGFLPASVISPYTYFLGDTKGHPLYFNQVKVPDYWEIRGTNSSGEIYDFDKLRGKINFIEPNYKRYVKSVEWYDRQGQLISVDHYNQYGRRFAQTLYSKEIKPVTTTYYHVDDREIVVVNHLTKNIILHTKKGLRIFESVVEFTTYFLKELRLNVETILYNTLAEPFFVTYQMDRKGKDILFWQEPIYDDIPGNMKLLLQEPYRETLIVVQHRDVYDKLKRLLLPNELEKVVYLGFIYEFKRQNTSQKTILNFTNSDEILHLEELIQRLPEYQFKIGALTEMSSKLMALSEYQNVVLYPNIAPSSIERLWQESDIYLDINYANEILFASRYAFENNLVLLGFEDTIHNRTFIAKEHIIQNNADDMVLAINKLFADKTGSLVKPLRLQKKQANTATAEDYKQVLRSVL